MSKIFNWFFGSFFRTLGRMLVFILLGYLCFYLFSVNDVKIPNIFGVLNVSALENIDDYTRPNSNGNYYFVNCNGADSCWNYAGGTNLSNGVVYNTTAIRTNTNGFGAGFVFSTDELFIKDNYYMIKVLFTPGEPLITNTFTNSSVKLLVGSGNGDYYMPLTTAESVSSYLVEIQDDYDDYAGSYLTYVFRATSNGDHLFIRFTSSRDYSGVFYFHGYQVTYLGSSKDDTAVINAIDGLNNGLNNVNNSVNDVNNSINNSNVNDATNDANNFFSNFTTNTHGLTGIITAPLNAINSLTSKTCSPLVLPLPFVNKDLTLPCMRQVYDDNFGDFMTLYDTITLGIVSYWVCVRIFSFVKDFKNPEHDEVEVVDL